MLCGQWRKLDSMSGIWRVEDLSPEVVASSRNLLEGMVRCVDDEDNSLSPEARKRLTDVALAAGVVVVRQKTNDPDQIIGDSQLPVLRRSDANPQ